MDEGRGGIKGWNSKKEQGKQFMRGGARQRKIGDGKVVGGTKREESWAENKDRYGK